MRFAWRHIVLRQEGQVLVTVLIMLALGGIMVVPLVQWMGTGLKSVQTYHRQTELVYAADAGINDGMWRIDAGEVPRTVDFSHVYPAITVKGDSVVVTIDYVWILSGIVDNRWGPHNQWLDVTTTGNPSVTGIYTINLAYDDISGNPGNKKVDNMGVWMPRGFQYVPGSAALFADNIYKVEPTVTPMHGGTSIKWTDVNYSFKSNGPTATQRFNFTPVGKIPRGDVAWVESLSSDIGVSWDSMIYSYTITSTATDPPTGRRTTIVSHVSSDVGTSAAGMATITYDIDAS